LGGEPELTGSHFTHMYAAKWRALQETWPIPGFRPPPDMGNMP
jgi:hypothetical protein